MNDPETTAVSVFVQEMLDAEAVTDDPREAAVYRALADRAVREPSALKSIKEQDPLRIRMIAYAQSLVAPPPNPSPVAFSPDNDVYVAELKRLIVENPGSADEFRNKLQSRLQAIQDAQEADRAIYLNTQWWPPGGSGPRTYDAYETIVDMIRTLDGASKFGTRQFVAHRFREIRQKKHRQ